MNYDHRDPCLNRRIPRAEHAPYGYSPYRYGGGSYEPQRLHRVRKAWRPASSDDKYTWVEWACRPLGGHRAILVSDPRTRRIWCPDCYVDQIPIGVDSFTYVARTRWHLKVGWSANLPHRMLTLGARLVAFAPGGTTEEEAVLATLGRPAQFAEYFALDREDRAIDALREIAGQVHDLRQETAA